MMTKTLPYLIFAIRKPRPSDSMYPPGLSRLEFEQAVLNDMLSHHYSYGHGGFLSEKTTLEGIFKKITNTEVIDAQYDRYVNPLPTIMKITTTGETLEENIAITESDPEFIRWARDPREDPFQHYYDPKTVVE